MVKSYGPYEKKKEKGEIGESEGGEGEAKEVGEKVKVPDQRMLKRVRKACQKKKLDFSRMEI